MTAPEPPEAHPTPEGATGAPIVQSAVSPAAALKNVKQHRWSRGQRRVPTDDEIRTANEHLKLRLRRWLAIIAGCAALLQVACADTVFILYAIRGRHWDLPPAAIESWLAATVVQVIGIVLVITRSLFPVAKDAE